MPLAILALVAVVALGGVPVARALAGHGVGPWSVGRLAPYLALTAGLAILGLVLALGASRLSSTTRCRLLVGLVACDLLLFTADQSSFAPLRSAALGQPSPLTAALGRAVDGGRFVIVDAARSGSAELNALGAPDLNALLGVASAQGYGSLLWAPYQAATGTHGQDVASPAAFAGTTFDSLDVRTLLAVPSDFAGPAGSGATDTARWHVGVTAPATRLFGGTIEVASVTLSLAAADRSRSHGAAPEPGAPSTGESVTGAPGARRTAGTIGAAVRHLAAAAAHLRLLGNGGRLLTPVGSPVTGDGSVTVHFRPAVAAAGLSLRLRAGSLSLSAPTVRPARGPRVALDGELAGAVTAPHWMPEGTIGPYTAYRDTRATGLYTLRPITEAAAMGPPARLAGGPARPLPTRTEVPGRQARLSRLEVLPGSPWSGQSTVDVWAGSTVALVRSVADLPGWHATLDIGGTSRPLPIARHGLVQSVVLPRGHSEVLFTYTAPGLEAGVAASIAGAAILLGLLALAATGERRRSSTQPPLGSPRHEGNPEPLLPARLPTG